MRAERENARGGTTEDNDRTSRSGARRRTHQTAIVVGIELVEHFAGPLQENAVILGMFIREKVHHGGLPE